AQSLVSAAPALLQITIDGAVVGNPFQLPTATCDWRQFCASWKSGNSLSADICVYNLNIAASGNDFALDDFSFTECKPAPCQVSINVTQNADCTVTVCAVTTGPQPVSYQWCDGRTDACFTTSQIPCVPTTYCVTATCSNSTTSSATVVYTIQDITPPVAVCNLGIGIDLGAACTFQVTPAFVDGGSTDNCGIQSMSVSPATLAACTNTIVTLTVTDWCGNTSTCTMGIQTIEGVPPIMTCPANTTIIGTVGPNGLCTAAYQPAKPPALDNCDPSVTVTHNAPAVLQQGPNTITWTATDDCGNQTTCTQIVTVQCSCDCVDNLVTNGSFENGAAGFPNALDQINQCSGWYAAANNPAANNIGDWYWDPSFPGFYLGPGQTPLPAHCGEKYAGFFLNTCEGITTQLSQTITQGCSYDVGFWWTPAVTPTTSFSFYAVMSGGNCTMYHPSGSCSHQCNGDQHVIVNVTPNHFAGTWYHHTMTVTNAYPNVGYMTFTAAQGAPNVNNYIFVDDVCVKKIAEPCSVTASIICYPENPIAYTAQATLGCGSLVTQVDWYFDGNGPNSSCCLNSILHPFTTIGWHTVCLVVTASNDGGHTICKDTMCKEVFIDHVPPTKCEKVLVNWQKLHTVDFLCCYALQLDNLEQDCFTEIELTLNSGTFANASITLGWTVIGNLNSNQITLIPTGGGFLPAGYFSPLTLCNPGGTGPYNLTVNLLYGLPPSEEKCEKNFPFDCPDTPIDSCCLDFDLFCQNVMNAVSVTVDNANCKATLNIGTLPACDYIEKIIWGDGTQTTGNFGPGSMPMHTYAQSGTYVIQYLAIEVNPHTGLICFEKFLAETIVVVCNECCKDEQAFQAAASAVQISSVYGNCTISVNATNMNDCLRITWNWGDGSPTEGPYSDNTPLTHTYSTYGLFVVSCTISEVDQFGNPCFTIAFSLPQRVECYVLCPDCEHNLVQNPGFFEGAVDGELGASGASNNWQTANNSPDVSAGIFCCDAYGIQMWGSQDKGEAICQTGFNFLPTKTYSISFSAYYDQPSSVAPYVQFGFYASSGCVNPFPNCVGCETMGVSVQITDQNCVTYTLPNWTPTASYNALIIKALTANPWPNLGFGRIDNICIQEVPQGCVCGAFSDIFARTGPGAPSQAIFCGADPITLICPPGGGSFNLTGAYQCQGTDCPTDYLMNWSLSGPSAPQSGSATVNGNFWGVTLPPTYFTQSGLYTLTLNAECGGQICPCILYFNVDCADVCPCDTANFLADLTTGFSTTIFSNSCNTCFTPINLTDCDKVEWFFDG
ncbi:MAG: hypothetical protein H7246_11350, partial [Phycisphaerae bacterium]|nr:hypothetical protein [Saprospiraceae bacterium]